MQLSMTARFLVAFLAGLLSGSGLALLTFWPSPRTGPLALSLVGVGMALLATVILARRRAAGGVGRDAGREGIAARLRLAGLDDVAAVVAALEALRRGYIAQGDGS